MQLDHEFTVPVPAAQAWPVLLDIDRIAPCMPGATVTKIDGDDFEGTVKVKVGPITVTYGGSASFLEKDESARRAVIEARGRETRGSGTATARVTAQIFDQGDSSRVVVNTDLSVTGKPAQFGRGVMADVGNKLIGRFADCLAGQLAGDQAAPTGAVPASAEVAAGSAPAAEGAGDQPDAGTPPGPQAPAAVLDAAPAAAAGAPVAAQPRQEAEAIDLMEAAGGAVAKRALPALGVLALLAVLFAVLRRRR
ncbi:MAG TPA: SRPBCC family protein [Mycobacteriales bacterium]|nr:SRPBCC family protein [Mycobacteriales bacterium]